MTNEEAINTLNYLKDYYNDKNEDSYVGFHDDDNEAIDMAIKALEQQPFINKPCVSEGVCREDKMQVLDKIRAEIEDLTYYSWEISPRTVIDDVLEIIDKYKAESENEE